MQDSSVLKFFFGYAFRITETARILKLKNPSLSFSVYNMGLSLLRAFNQILNAFEVPSTESGTKENLL